MGFKGRLIEAVAGFFVNRFQFVSVDHSFSNSRRTAAGVPQGCFISMICFLLSFNDCCDNLVYSDYALFMDDIAGWCFDRFDDDLISKVNSDFSSLYRWSVSNQQVFSAEKFHIFNLISPLGNNAVRGIHLSNLVFGDYTCSTSVIDKYIGLKIDRRLKFIEHIKFITSKVERNIWRISSISGPRGRSASVLNRTFQAYILPLFDYACPVWIFQCFDIDGFNIDYYQKPNRSYGNVFSNLNKLYMRCARLILSVHPGSSTNGILVRIGWMPLKYLLVHRTICWFYRIYKDVGSVNNDQFHRFYNNDDLFHNSIFYRPCLDFIGHLNGIYRSRYRVGFNILDCRSIDHFKSLSRDLIFLNLSDIWCSFPEGRHTFGILPEWSPRVISPSLVSRRSESMYYSLCFSKNNLKSSRYIHTFDDDVCRFCDFGRESVHHIFMDCFGLDHSILRDACASLNIEYNLVNFLTNPRMKIYVEHFLKNNFL